MRERNKLLLMLGIFAVSWSLPLESPRFIEALTESLHLLRWYAQEHVILCLLPAFFIAGAIAVFLSQGAVMKHLGPQARRLVAYPVAALSGGILAVCSCTILPLFASIYKRGAGLGPASAFLYSGPAINVMAIILTAQILGFELGIARALAAVLFSLLIGLMMALLFRKEESARSTAGTVQILESLGGRRPGQDALSFAAMLALLIFANWAEPRVGSGAFWSAIHSAKWGLTGLSLLLLFFVLWRWFERDELEEWVESSWDFAKQIMPLLFAGVLVAGFLLGGPDGGQGLIPQRWVSEMVGENSLSANLFASVAGALMYFATLTEVPILKGLLNAGMDQGPALALLLAGPALSLPNMLVIHSVLGVRKTLAFSGLVVLLSSTAGLMYGSLF